VLVVDASLGVKWFLDEADSEQATNLLVANRTQISVPDLFGIEVASALVRECNMRKEDSGQFSWALARFGALLGSRALVSVRTEASGLAEAASIALDLGHPLKDCIYLALAMNLGCPLVTCDYRFAAKAVSVWELVETL
jgi:predicted nucleic acid-binding protein